MPDMSMCKNYQCIKRDNCYRYRAVPSTHWQSYMMPIAETCKHFWMIDKDSMLSNVALEDRDNQNKIEREEHYRGKYDNDGKY